LTEYTGEYEEGHIDSGTEIGEVGSDEETDESNRPVHKVKFHENPQTLRPPPLVGQSFQVGDSTLVGGSNRTVKPIMKTDSSRFGK